MTYNKRQQEGVAVEWVWPDSVSYKYLYDDVEVSNHSNITNHSAHLISVSDRCTLKTLTSHSHRTFPHGVWGAMKHIRYIQTDVEWNMSSYTETVNIDSKDRYTI